MAGSKLKQGPKKPDHKLFQHNQRLINAALCKNLINRRINVKACELYREANITPPTFYLHHRNSNDDLVSYESALELDLTHRIPPNAKKEVIFTILIDFMIQNQQYFLAVNHSYNCYLLAKLIINYRTNLVGDTISDRLFMLYAGKVVVVLTCWLTHDELNSKTSASCIHDLMSIRIGRVW